MSDKVITYGVIGGVVLLIGFTMFRGGDAPNQAPTLPLNTEDPMEVAGGDESDEFAALLAFIEESDVPLGSADAPVVLVEFGDYQCTFCKRFFDETKDTLVEEYVETGKLRYVFRDFPVNGRESQTSAEASECANEQGRFWEYHDKLYEVRTGYNTGVFSRQRLIQYAQELGLDVDQFTQCYDDGRYEEEIAKDMADGRRLGVSGTPTFLINGQRLVGAQPTSVFTSAIEQLAEQMPAPHR